MPALQRFAQRVHVRAALPAIEQVLDEIKHRLVVGVRARKAQRLVQRAELLTAATARAPAGAQEPLALGGGVGPEGLAQLGQPPDGARALGNTACLAHARFTLCGRCRASSSCSRGSCDRCPRGARLWTLIFRPTVFEPHVLSLVAGFTEAATE